VNDRGRLGLGGIGLALWLALVVGAGAIALATGVDSPGLVIATATVLMAVGVIALVAYARFASAAPQLRGLRVLAILLPSLFIIAIEVVLLLVEADELFTEVGEHVLATVVLSIAAIPFSIWIFRRFADLHEQLAVRDQEIATIEERERIARELHDDLGQLLGFLTAKIQAARELLATDRADLAAQELADLEAAARTLSEQVRESILGLRTSVGPERPLAQALETYTAEFGIQAGLDASYVGETTGGDDLPLAARYQLLRITQEALSNARQHARARTVTVTLAQRDHTLILEVRDDGAGFDPETAASSGRFGLKTMAERARAIGGSLDVRSSADGTTVVASVPVGG
jgi:signal transduction histidine kinase